MQTEDGNEAAYAYMRELYKLTINIRDHGNTMLDSAYNYLYIPSTIGNFDDSTLQRIFWLERLGVTAGDDELTEYEQSTMQTKANDTKWQNVEYDEYYECIYDVGEEEEANVYALFPFGAPVVRSYYMLKEWDEIISNGYKPGKHEAVDMFSRDYAKRILERNDAEAELLYYYELNRLTLKYMQNGNTREDAFLLAEKTLNSELEGYILNSPIVAIAPGRVTMVGYNARSGFHVQITHDSGDSSEAQIQSLYVHLKRWPEVEIGDVVGAGTILGYEGTTGRSTGNHLHLVIKVDGKNVDPKEYILPVFSPFYYDEKAVAVLEEDAENALASEYYTLERTILPEVELFANNNVINGMKLSNGTTVINYDPPIALSRPYNSGDDYVPSVYNVKWGNNVPSGEMADSLDKIIDLTLLNQTIKFEAEDGDNPSGDHISNENDVTADPAFFTEDKRDFESKHKFDPGDAYNDFDRHKRLEWPKWYAAQMAEYRSELVVPYYNGPRSRNDEISTEEAFKDLIAMQESLEKAGYYARAGINIDEAGYGVYSDLFEKVVRTMQQDLIEYGYGVYGVKINGKLDVLTVAAYNTMLQYTTAVNQFAMGEKTSYNSTVNLSMEPALIWAIIATEGEDGNKDELALKESKEEEDSVTVTLTSYEKVLKRAQGLMQLKPSKVINRYKAKGASLEEAVIYVTQPMKNTNMGIEMIKEYMLYFNQSYAAKIETVKNEILFRGHNEGYWCYSVFNPGFYYTTRWCDPENIDRVMLYALALDAYDKEGVGKVNVDNILKNGPNGYAKDVLNRMIYYILDSKKGTGTDIITPNEDVKKPTKPTNPSEPVNKEVTIEYWPEGEIPEGLTPEEANLVVEMAKKYLGKPYGRHYRNEQTTGPDSFDCSGLVWKAFDESGVATFPRTSAEYIYKQACGANAIKEEDLQVGDLVFFTNSEEGINHIGIYLGNGNMIHSSGSEGVEIDTVSSEIGRNSAFYGRVIVD